jgi:hypothetical protein
MIIAFYPGAGGNRYLLKTIGKEWTNLGISYDNQVGGQQYLHRYLLESEILETNSEYILTHCMNADRIRQTFPNQPIIFIKSDMQQSLKREWMLAGHSRFISKRTKFKNSRIDHYNKFKDLTWPHIETEEQLDELPSKILKEVNSDYKKISDIVIDDPGILQKLKQKYMDEINSSYEIINWHMDYYRKFPVDFSGASKIVDITNDQTNFTKLMQKELKFYQSQVFDQVWEKIHEQR